MPGNLRNLRRQIDETDRRIVRLLSRRAALAARIGREKRRTGLPLRDFAREAEVLRRVRRLGRGPLRGKALAAVYRRIIAVCAELEK